MAKIGTAHIEIKPVIDEATLEALTVRIAAAVAEGVRRGGRVIVNNHCADGQNADDNARVAATRLMFQTRTN